jgi:uncharacterized membrane protein (UPF0127 family)
VVAALEVADGRRARRRGLRGRSDFGGALLLRPCRQVHTLGMRFPIDVAFVDEEGCVIAVTALRPWRVSRPVLAARAAVEAREGSFERWGVGVGATLEVLDPTADGASPG